MATLRDTGGPQRVADAAGVDPTASDDAVERYDSPTAPSLGRTGRRTAEREPGKSAFCCFATGRVKFGRIKVGQTHLYPLVRPVGPADA